MVLSFFVLKLSLSAIHVDSRMILKRYKMFTGYVESL